MKTKSKSKLNINNNNPPLSVAVVLGLTFAVLLYPLIFLCLPEKYTKLSDLIGGGLSVLWFAGSIWILVEWISISRKERNKKMTPKEFEDYLVSLSEEDYDKLMQERIARLSPENQTIMQAREIKRKKTAWLIDQARKDPANDELQHKVFDQILDMQEDYCEHERSTWSNCIACGELDHAMFPELFNESGEHLGEDYEED